MAKTTTHATVTGKVSRTAAQTEARTVTVGPETKRQRFERIGKLRMNNAIHAIALLGNLSAVIYDYTPEDVENMKSILLKTVDDTFALYAKRTKAREPFDFTS